MRRMSAAGAAILLCLALGGTPVLAQEAAESPTPVVPAVQGIVTGELNNSADPWVHDVSDPRLSGEVEFVTLVETAYTGSGTLTIKGPEGDWSGPVIAVWNEGLDAYVAFLSANGTGAYEGWAFVATYFEKGDGHGEANGVIYKGEVPRQVWPEPVEPSAE